jgi:RNA polymerase-binding transcription factor DksA
MANGWAHDGAVLDQIEDTVTGGVSTARARLPSGPGTDECVECGEDIPEARRKACPGRPPAYTASPAATAAS